MSVIKGLHAVYDVFTVVCRKAYDYCIDVKIFDIIKEMWKKNGGQKYHVRFEISQGKSRNCEAEHQK